MAESWQVHISDGDVRAAKQAWLEAQRDGAPAERVAALHSGYESLVRTQARQLAEAVRACHARA